jgi:thymidylate synthase
MIIPTFLIKAKTIPEAQFLAIRKVYEEGMQIRTQYDRRDNEGNYLDPLSRDAKVLIEVENPFKQPRYPMLSFCEIGKYIAEIMGVKDHLVIDTKQMLQDINKGNIIDTKWPYTYSQRLRRYPSMNEGYVTNQLDLCIEKLSKDPITRRAVASTAIPFIDNYLKEDIPCLREIHLRCTEENNILYLHMDTKWRSRDLFKGWGDNVIGMTFLQQILAMELGIEMNREVLVGSYTDYSSSLHIYGQDINKYDVEKFIRDNHLFVKAFTSEEIKDLLILPQLKELLKEDMQWNFPVDSLDMIKELITGIETGALIA